MYRYVTVATFFSCILLGNKMYPLKQTFKLRQMDTMIRNAVGRCKLNSVDP